jgi:hypothetical protein
LDVGGHEVARPDVDVAVARRIAGRLRAGDEGLRRHGQSSPVAAPARPRHDRPERAEQHADDEQGDDGVLEDEFFHGRGSPWPAWRRQLWSWAVIGRARAVRCSGSYPAVTITSSTSPRRDVSLLIARAAHDVEPQPGVQRPDPRRVGVRDHHAHAALREPTYLVGEFGLVGVVEGLGRVARERAVERRVEVDEVAAPRIPDRRAVVAGAELGAGERRPRRAADRRSRLWGRRSAPSGR